MLRAKPAAERAATAQKGWATRRAKAAAAQLAELEAEGPARLEGQLLCALSLYWALSSPPSPQSAEALEARR